MFLCWKTDSLDAVCDDPADPQGVVEPFLIYDVSDPFTLEKMD